MFGITACACEGPNAARAHTRQRGPAAARRPPHTSREGASRRGPRHAWHTSPPHPRTRPIKIVTPRPLAASPPPPRPALVSRRCRGRRRCASVCYARACLPPHAARTLPSHRGARQPVWTRARARHSAKPIRREAAGCAGSSAHGCPALGPRSDARPCLPAAAAISPRERRRCGSLCVYRRSLR